MKEVIDAIEKSFNENTYRCVLSNAACKDNKYKKILIKLKENGFQVEKYTDTQVFHENVSSEAIKEFLIISLSKEYKQFNSWDSEKEYSIKISNKGKVLVSSKKTDIKPELQKEHNRSKKYILQEGTIIPPLVDMGIFTKDGKVVKSMYDKYKQINRFVEIIDDEVSGLNPDKELHIVDFGCGKSYLTFVLYYYFTEVKKLNVKMTGLDLKSEVINKCNSSADKYGYKNLEFKMGDINGYNFESEVDIIITLHACDTATDYALYNGIKADAKMIFSVPCCQHELNSQIETDNLSILTRYGIIKERVAALMTDSIRANLLEYCGYKTQLLEFIDFEHTPKNILIRAVKKTRKEGQREEALKEVENLIKEFNLEPTLYKLLKDRF